MPNVKPTLTIAIRDEATAALDRLKAQFLRDVNEGRVDGLPSKMAGLETVAFKSSYEIGSALRVMGIASVISAGGIVASLAAMTSALSNFARQSQRLRYLGEELGLTSKELIQFQNAARLRTGLPAESVMAGFEFDGARDCRVQPRAASRGRNVQKDDRQHGAGCGRRVGSTIAEEHRGRRRNQGSDEDRPRISSRGIGCSGEYAMAGRGDRTCLRHRAIVWRNPRGGFRSISRTPSRIPRTRRNCSRIR